MKTQLDMLQLKKWWSKNSLTLHDSWRGLSGRGLPHLWGRAWGWVCRCLRKSVPMLLLLLTLGSRPPGHRWCLPLLPIQRSLHGGRDIRSLCICVCMHECMWEREREREHLQWSNRHMQRRGTLPQVLLATQRCKEWWLCNQSTTQCINNTLIKLITEQHKIEWHWSANP